MGNLSNLYISQSFTSLAHLGTNNALVPGTMTRLEDGIGQSLNISFDGTNISSSGNIFAANLTGSADTGSFMLTGSVSVNVLTFTKADGSTFDLTVSASGSVVPGTISSSAQIVSLGFLQTSSFNTYTSSTNSRLNNIETTTASLNSSVSQLNASSASQQVSINSLNAATASYVTETESGSFLLTASFDNGTRNLTFTKGNNTTFAVNIPDVSGSSTLPSGVISGSAQITSLGFVSSSITASSIITASINNDDITFTKGDGSQFTIQVATGSFALSSSYAETASLATNALDIIVNVKNTTGAQINKGTVVRIIGATGDNPLIGTASWTNDLNSANTLGFVVSNIANDGFGRVMTQGTLLSVNTDPALGYTAGQLVYLSSSGQFTNVKPPAPFHEVRLGQVLRAQQNNGSIYVLVQNGYELDELHDVDINTGSLLNNDLLAWDSASQQWTNKTVSGVGATTTSSFNSYTSSTNSRLTNIESTTASLLVETQNLELFSASALTSLSNLNTATASLFTSASLALTTASVSGQTMTFRKGDGTTFNVTLPAGGSGSIDTASFATTGSNSFNGSQTITGSITTTQDITISGVRFGFGNPAGTSSIAIGNSSTLANNTDDNSIAIGYDALNQNTTGERNIGIGTQALRNIRGNSSYNTAIGAFALSVATSSTNTLSLGFASMENAQDSTNNIAIGVAALYRKKTNSNGNTAIGTNALREHYDGDSNTGQNMAFGFDSMANVTSGSANTAIGTATLRDAARANENVFIGWISGINASGSISQNVVIGPRAGQKIAGSSNTFIGHNAGTDIVNGGTNIFIGQGAGAAIVTGSSNTLIGSIPGVDNWSNVIAIADGSSGIKTKFQSNIWEFTGSVDIQNTLTASLQQGYVWVGNSAGRTVTVATSSFGGGSTINTGSFATTGSNTFTGDQTLIDASSNYFTIVNASGSLMLVGKTMTSSSLHISSSAVAVGSGAVNLIFKSNNVAADTIISGSNNIFQNPPAPQAGFKRYLSSNNIVLGGGFPQISGSMQFSPNVTGNYFGGGLTMRGPVSSSAWAISNNNNLGLINIGNAGGANSAEKLTSGLTLTGNSIAGTMNVLAGTTPLTASAVIVTNNNVNGTATFALNQSALTFTGNIVNDSNFVLTNNYVSQSAGLGSITVSRNNIAGQNNQIIITGSQPAGTTNATSYTDNFMGGAGNILFADVSTARVVTTNAYHSAARNMIFGQNLIVTASSFTGDTTGLGSAFFGRFNDVNGNKDLTAETIFAVGTGTSTSNRKTGFLIDSGSNSFFEGTVNISGSLLVNGIAPSAIATGSFATTGSNSFVGNQTITGSLLVSGSTTLRGNTTFISTTGNTTNIILGNNAMSLQSASFENVAIGSNALKVTFGNNNFAMGTNALENNTGNANIALGSEAGRFASGSSNVLVGQRAGQYLTGSANTILGGFESTTGSLFDNNIILADGVGNVRARYSGSAWAFQDNIKFNKGSNKTTDIVTVNSSLTVSNSLVTSDSIILVTTQDNQNAPSIYPATVSSKGTGTFTINHNYGGNLQVAYLIINPT